MIYRSGSVITAVIRLTMSVETRNLETRYFNVDDSTLLRVRHVRGQFDAYDGAFETLNVTWWLESPSARRPITHADIETLVAERDDIESVGLANYFADANDLGNVISDGYTSLIDFSKSFSRTDAEMFPRVEDGALLFTTSKKCGEHHAGKSEFYDVRIDLRTLGNNKTLFWSGRLSELTLVSDRQNDG